MWPFSDIVGLMSDLSPKFLTPEELTALSRTGVRGYFRALGLACRDIGIYFVMKIVEICLIIALKVVGALVWFLKFIRGESAKEKVEALRAEKPASGAARRAARRKLVTGGE